jgi:hypothetical protein
MDHDSNIIGSLKQSASYNSQIHWPRSNPAKVVLLDNFHLKISPCSSIAMLVPDAFFIVKDFCIVLHAGRLSFS